MLINGVTYSSSYTFCSINNVSISVERSNFHLVFFEAACHANPGVERNFAGSSPYILKHKFRKFSNTPDNNNVSL